MYIAGLDLALSPPQALEALVVLSTGEYFRHSFAKISDLAVVSETKSGRIRTESMPPTFLGRIITPIHALAMFTPPLIYVGAVVLNGFRQPDWFAKFTFHTEMIDPTWKSALRVAACIASFALKRLTDRVYDHLGDQWHSIGRRERPRVIETGPYAWVRHPGYSTVLLQEVLWSIMFWSYAPLVALAATASAFAIKMPIEESLIQKDDAVREEYRQYMRKVPARILPYVW